MALFRLISCVLAAGALLSAQSTVATGTVQGSVVDTSSGVVAGARVTIRNQDTKAERSTVSGSAGAFALQGLPIGTYTISVQAPGFAPLEAGPFLLSVGQILVRRVELRPAGITEQVEVREEPEAIDTSAVSSSVALGYERIEEAPARSRNYLNFVLAAPAVAPSTGSSSQRTMTGVRSPLGDSGFTFGGMRARNNSILIDGMDNRDETTGGNRVAVGLEMVQEFRIAGTAIGAELGGAAGGLLNMVTRSGVNIWHGDFTFFGQNEFANARKAEAGPAAKPDFRRYQPGISANGPLRRNRTFISGAIENERETGEEWSNLDSSAVALLNGALASNGFAFPLRAFRGLYGTSTRGFELSTKLNHQINAKETISARYAFSRGRVRQEVQGPDNFADRSAQGSSLTVDHSLVGNCISVVTPTLVNDFRFQVGERQMELRPNAAGAMLDIPGVATLGQYHRMDADRSERHYQVVENLNFGLGNHRLSAGVDVHAIALDASLRNRFGGIYVFPTLTDFVEGRPDLFIQAFGNPSTSFRTLPVGAFLQDRWEPIRGLSLEAGIRYDRQKMPAGISSSSENFAPRLGAAWKPMDRRPFVLRAGLGLFFDRYPLSYLNEALQKDGVHAFEQYAAGPAARSIYAATRGRPAAAPLSGIEPSTYRTSAAFPSTYSSKATVGWEYGLGHDASLSMEASYIRGFHLPRIRNYSATLPPVYLLEQTARSEYLGVSVSANRRMNKDLAYLVTYTLGPTRDDGSDFDEQPLDPFHIRADWALSRQHQKHRLAASGLFEIPLERMDVPEFLQHIFEDISYAPILSVGSGRPINALFTTDLYRTGAYPISARPPGIPRNPYLSPVNINFDLRVMKTFPIHEGRALLQFGVESFNLLNHTNTERVSQFFASTAGPLASYGQNLESLPARQVQFLIQFEY